MRVLLDTHILIWMLNGFEQLTDDREFQELFFYKIDEVYFSPLSIWEIELKKNIGKAGFQYDGREIYLAAIDSNMTPLPLYPINCLKLEDIDLPQKDPFDRMLLAQAKDNGMVFLTHDLKFKDIDDENIYYLPLNHHTDKKISV